FETRVSQAMIEVNLRRESGGEGPQLLIGICNKNPQGGGLGGQVEQLAAAAAERKRVLVVVRSSEYPSAAGTKIAKIVGELIAKGGRRVVVNDGDWRVFQALRDFLQEHAGDAHASEWRKLQRPLSRLECLRKILSLDELAAGAAAAPAV